MQVIIQFIFQEIIDESTHGFSSWLNFLRTQFCFCLRFKNWLNNFHCNCSNNRLTNIRSLIIFIVKITNHLCDRFAKSTLMRSTLCCVLTVYERIIILTVSSSVRKGNFNVFIFNVDNWIKRITIHVIFQ